jgi:hypothetical protein
VKHGRERDAAQVQAPSDYVVDQAIGLGRRGIAAHHGHARRETLAVYQHVAVDGELAERYQAAMKDADL